MIASFHCKQTERLFNGEIPQRSQEIAKAALRKLDMPDAAATLNDLRVPPGNRLEALKGARAGQHSIRINGQWRICFAWRGGEPHDVEIVDYH